MATLPAVTETAAWSDRDLKHGRYIAENRTLGHTEDPANPWYTPEGAAPGLAGNVAEACTARGAVDLWMAGPFYAIGIIDPRLTSSGFGVYTSAGGDCGAALDIGRAATGHRPPTRSPGPVRRPRSRRMASPEASVPTRCRVACGRRAPGCR